MPSSCAWPASTPTSTPPTSAPSRTSTAGRDTTDHLALLARLHAAGKCKELAAIEALSTDVRTWTAEQYGAYAKIAATSDPLTFSTMKSVVMKSPWFSPLHSLGELGALGKGMNSPSRSSPPPPGSMTGPTEPASTCRSFFIFQGDQDVLTPTDRAKRFFDDVQAPLKDLAPGYEPAGHSQVIPLTVRRRGRTNPSE
ncbi:hypothetical protein [Kitasatospora indigofera]|uniref:hypothetical protein n=1 Tax=Kitasatospora indigofera TaxID=67307 RepID=UPI0033A2F606